MTDKKSKTTMRNYRLLPDNKKPSNEIDGFWIDEWQVGSGSTGPNHIARTEITHANVKAILESNTDGWGNIGIGALKRFWGLSIKNPHLLNFSNGLTELKPSRAARFLSALDVLIEIIGWIILVTLVCGAVNYALTWGGKYYGI